MIIKQLLFMYQMGLIVHNLLIMISRMAFIRGLYRPHAPFSTKKIEIFINNKPYQVDSNLSIFQAAKENGI